MKKLCIVAFTQQDRSLLTELISSGEAPANKITHACILLKADSSPKGLGWKDQQIREALDVGLATIARVWERFAKEGLDVALNRKRSLLTHPRKPDGEVEAHLIALACSRLLRVTDVGLCACLPGRWWSLGMWKASPMRRSVWPSKRWCIPLEANADFVCHTEDVLDVYARPDDPRKPMICLDETSKQLLGDVREALPEGPGK